MRSTQTCCFKPIGHVNHTAADVPRHWSLSRLEGRLVIDGRYEEGLRDIHAGQDIVVIFGFHRAAAFTADRLITHPPHRDHPLGVFSSCSPVRPNPIGLSVLRVLTRKANVITVRGLDMLDGTPILDIKPHIDRVAEGPKPSGNA